MALPVRIHVHGNYTIGLTLKYVQRASSGAWRYRRRIPEGLQTILDKTEFVKKLGDSEAEALRNYPAVHHAVEQVLAEATVKLDCLPQPETKARLVM